MTQEEKNRLKSVDEIGFIKLGCVVLDKKSRKFAIVIHDTKHQCNLDADFHTIPLSLRSPRSINRFMAKKFDDMRASLIESGVA